MPLIACRAWRRLRSGAPKEESLVTGGEGKTENRPAHARIHRGRQGGRGQIFVVVGRSRHVSLTQDRIHCRFPPPVFASEAR